MLYLIFATIASIIAIFNWVLFISLIIFISLAYSIYIELGLTPLSLFLILAGIATFFILVRILKKK
ncbi:MAG: hypothetical protein KU37_10815 [Sulfuricurvum sp. PC08-66]|nr:MAG: hypothetical protein KU37_10815 [Sulfuricurvum sp. PC08-66]